MPRDEGVKKLQFLAISAPPSGALHWRGTSSRDVDRLLLYMTLITNHQLKAEKTLYSIAIPSPRSRKYYRLGLIPRSLTATKRPRLRGMIGVKEGIDGWEQLAYRS